MTVQHVREQLADACDRLAKSSKKLAEAVELRFFGGLTIDDLQALELSYAPPYSSPKDPINMAGYKAVSK